MNIKTIIIPAAIGFGIGLLVTVQFKAPRQRILNPVEPYARLSESRETLAQKVEKLKTEIKAKREENTALQEKLKSSRKATEVVVEELNRLKAEAGLTQIKASGVVVTLADAPKGELTIDSIIHAADLRDLVNVLWRAKAQAVSVNDERVVATSSIDSIINTVLVNNTRITSPFVIKATGDSRELAEAVESAENLSDLQRRRKNSGIVFNIERTREVTMPAFSGSFNIEIAKVSQ